MKKVLIITYYWPPAGGAGVQRWLKMSKYLPGFGVEPIILTVHPNHASYPVSDQGFLKEIPEGLRVITTKSFEPLQVYSRLFGKGKVPYSGFANVETESFFSRISRWVRGNFFIPDARKGWNNYALTAGRNIIESDEIDTVITTGPPHSTHLIGMTLKEESNVKWIADFRDPWTDIYYYGQLLHTKRSKKKDKSLELEVLTKADKVLTVCPSNREVLASKLPEAIRHRIRLLPNGFDEQDFEGNQKMSFEKFTIVYTGTMAATYNFAPLFTALSGLEIDWQLIIAGSISPEVNGQIEKIGLENRIDFRGYIAHNEVLKILTGADLLVHVLPRGERGTSGKLFEYIGSGKPILNIGRGDGDSAFYIDRAKAGATFDGERSEPIADFIDSVRDGKLIFDSDRSSFSRRARAERLADLLRE